MIPHHSLDGCGARGNELVCSCAGISMVQNVAPTEKLSLHSSASLIHSLTVWRNATVFRHQFIEIQLPHLSFLREPFRWRSIRWRPFVYRHSMPEWSTPAEFVKDTGRFDSICCCHIPDIRYFSQFVFALIFFSDRTIAWMAIIDYSGDL